MTDKEQIEATKPKFCPFCGFDAKPLQETPSAPWMVYCNNWRCSARGPDREERQEAITAWNLRITKVT